MTRSGHWFAFLFAALVAGCQPRGCSPPAATPLVELSPPSALDKEPQGWVGGSGKEKKSEFELKHLETAVFLKMHEHHGIGYLGHDGDFHYLLSRWDDTIYGTPRKSLTDETMLTAAKAKRQREKTEPLVGFPHLTRSKEWLNWLENANLIEPERE